MVARADGRSVTETVPQAIDPAHRRAPGDAAFQARLARVMEQNAATQARLAQ